MGSGPELESGFLSLVRETAHEAPEVVNDLVARGLATPERVGVAGWSMGGFIAYAAVVADTRIRLAAPILGSPEWRLPWPDSPHRRPDSFLRVALLSQTAGADERVSPHFARAFHRTPERRYAISPERLQYVEYEGVGHNVPDQVGDKMRRTMVEWFTRHLVL